MLVDHLIVGALAAIIFSFIYFISIAPLLKRRFLKKHGVKVVAEIKYLEKTGYNMGSGSIKEPVWRIELLYSYANKTYTVSKNKGFSKSSSLPKVGSSITILIDPQKPTYFLMPPY
ncbi:hypothetical protein HH214_10605 [Mucilaginibacter robiniae]|uniref:DUF3592 domain-containing protein n=1 Tax=Mucilaginibacter robiniae TaxID=2728022 RepID=A0A7L5DYV1_9SPHI|nr:hypothetical protein [Mucilaginibacter robiniae]QJD96280.1 hypothetical protein HH214_10605 [Mucilaginibacter robiniae]